jgi:hypothetical protein
MKRKFYFFVAGILLYFFMGNITYGQQCGPGPHWIDGCAGGTDSFQSTATIWVDLNLDCIGDFPLSFQGPTIVVRQPSDTIDPGNGMCPKPFGHTGNFHIETEIVNATLTAPAPGGGQFILKFGHSANPELQPSIGHVVEEADPAKGCSYFCIYFKLFVPAGVFGPDSVWLYNQTCCVMYSAITQAPPSTGTDYSFPQCIELFTSPLVGQGIHIANATDPHHTVIPTLSQWGLIIFALLLAAAGAIFILRRKRVFLLHRK